MKKEEQTEKPELAKITGTLSSTGALVQGSENIENLLSRGYGTVKRKRLALNLCETLFLQSNDVLEVTKQKSKAPLSFQELLHKFEQIDKCVWIKYLIYRDLRSRGYVVREGFGLETDFRFYERGEYGKTTAAYLILGIQEGKPVSTSRLASILRHTQALKKRLVLAVINRRGEIVYYTLSKLTMKKP